MKILVTGSSGFLGTHLCDHLEYSGHTVSKANSKNCDLTDPKSLNVYGSNCYDQIVHLAAWTQAGEFCLHHPGEQWIINQQINTNILAWWRTFQPQAKFICMGTSCAYSLDLPLSEGNYLKGQPINSLFTYAMTKRMLYAGLLAMNQQFGLEFLCLVPSTLYGTGYHTDGRQMHFIFDLIRKILRGKIYNEPVVLWGTGYQTRELVYVEDFIEAMLQVDKVAKNDLINLGAGEEFSIRYFAKIICNYVDYDFENILFDTGRYVGANSKCLDISKFRNICPSFEYPPVLIGIHRTIDWFILNKEKLLSAESINP